MSSRDASRHDHQGGQPRQPERRIHPAGGRVALGLPDESGVPVVLSGCARPAASRHLGLVKPGSVPVRNPRDR